MNPTYISRNDISAEELAKLQEITVDAALNDPASLPKPILNKLIDKAMNSSAWSDEDKAIYEEKKSNMNYLFNFLSKEAAAALGGKHNALVHTRKGTDALSFLPELMGRHGKPLPYFHGSGPVIQA